MKQLLILILLLGSIIGSGQKTFVPSSPYPIFIKQSDGSELILYASGDENIHYPNLPASYSVDDFGKLMNQPNYKGSGSFRDYFLDCSDGSLTISTDVYGWFTAANNYEYYGEKQGDGRARQLVAEAIDAAELAGVDFSQYDNNGDGYLDNLIVVHSGPGAEEGSQKR